MKHILTAISHAVIGMMYVIAFVVSCVGAGWLLGMLVK